ncbi:tetratricopeptide repeat protein [bacterium]|nr:tetratricopeptide repeat protein [bacterium]
MKYINSCICAILIFISLLFSHSAAGQAEPKFIPQKELKPLLKHAASLASVHIDTSIRYIDSLISEFKTNRDTNALIQSTSSKSFILCYDSRYEEALLLSYKALDLQETYDKDSLLYGIIYLNMALPLDGFGRKKEAVEKTKLALEYVTKFGNEDLIDIALNNLGAFTSEVGNHHESINYYQRSAEIRRKKKEYFWLAYSYFNIANSYRDLKQQDSFSYYILKSKNTFENDAKTEVPAMVKYLLADYYSDIGDLKPALKLTIKAIADSRKIGNTEMVLEGLLKESKLHELMRNYKKAYITRMQYDSLNHELDSINSASRVAEIEKQLIQAKADAKIEKLNSDRLEAEKQSNEFRSYLLISITLLILFIALGYIFYLQKSRQNEKEKNQLQTDLEQTQLMALRAQMNPHFIFNSINLAQSFILSSNKEKAYDHMEKFAKLLRLFLNNSTELYIPLSDEIEQLNYYLALEKNRFENKFDYDITVDEGLNSSPYEIPGMLIQPFVENALIHGILNLNNRKGILNLHFNKDSQFIICKIIDNGVGRERAEEIKALKDQKYQAVAMNNISKRMDLLSKLYDLELSYQIEDLTDDSGEPSGTSVTVKIPLL